MSQKSSRNGILKSAQNVTLSLRAASSDFKHSRQRESAQCCDGVAMMHSITSVNSLWGERACSSQRSDLVVLLGHGEAIAMRRACGSFGSGWGMRVGRRASGQ